MSFKLDNLKAVFFDADDTLFRVKGTVGSRYLPYLLSAGINTTEQEINLAVPKAWQALKESYENKENKHVTDHQRDIKIWHEYVNNVLSYLTDKKVSDDLFTAIYEDFSRADSRLVFPYVEDLLIRIKSLGLITGILTNNDKRIHNLISELGLSAHFDHIYCASDLGYKKPSPNIFHAVTNSVGVKSNEIIYIGDCPENDIHGATNAGWHALWFASGHKDIKTEDQRLINLEVKSIKCFSEALEWF